MRFCPGEHGEHGEHDGEDRQVQDSVHGLITLSPLAYRIINTSVFKRLKGLKQLGCVHEVYPSGVHTRFEHSLGVMHIAGELCSALNVTGKDKLCVEIAGLCHDLGHGPFSHLYEALIRTANPESKWTHEQSSLDMLDLIIQRYKIDLSDYNLDDNDLDFIKELIYGPLDGQDKTKEFPYKGRGPEKYFLYEIISNKITGVDVDKWDYFLRDNLSLKIGITFDYKRFLKNVGIKEWPFFANDESSLMVNRIAIREKEFDNCQEMFLDRSRLHRKGYQHRVTRIFDKMMIDAWIAANEFFPPVAGKCGILYTLAEACDDVVALSKLTDEWVNQTIRNSSEPGLEKARDILKRIDDRDKYKVIAEIGQGPLNKSEQHYEESLLFSTRQAGLSDDVEEDGAQDSTALRPGDLCVIKNMINMGRKDGTNPVLNMLFYDKSGRVEVKTEDELKQIAPAKLFEEKLFVLCRRNAPEVLAQATQAVGKWVANCPDWQVRYKNQGASSAQKQNTKSLSPIFGVSATSDGRAEE